MAPDCPALSITPVWQEDQVFLVGAVDALRLCRTSGYAALDAGQAVWALGAEQRRLGGEMRDFIARARLTGLALSGLDDAQVVTLLATRLKNGDVVALQRVEQSTSESQAPDATAKLRRLVRDIDAKTGGRLSHSGRQYKLIVGLQLGKLPNRDSYQVVGHDEALRILDGIAKQPGTPADVHPLLDKARDELSGDWRPPLEPNGLVLLRRNPTVAATAPEQVAPMSPSQLRRAMLTWITIEVVDENDKPWSGAVDMTLTNGSQLSIPWSDSGAFHQEDIQPGTVTVTFKSAQAK